MERFGIGQVFALHTSVTLPAGSFGTRPGPIMASVDEFEIRLTGKGGHGAYPHLTVDPVAAAMQMGQALNGIVSRNVGALDNVVLSLTMLQAGTARNVIPHTALLGGTVRSYSKDAQRTVKRRIEEIVQGTAAAMGVAHELDYIEDFPPTVNHPAETDFAAATAAEVAGAGNVVTDIPPRMGGEDFSFMLENRPGAFVFIGQGDGPFPHHPEFDFNDEVAPLGASYFARLVERAQPVG